MTNQNIVSKGSNFMEQRITQDANRLIKEAKETRDRDISFNWALTLLGLRYTSPQYRAKAAAMLEARMMERGE
jgi:hypothetical protein